MGMGRPLMSLGVMICSKTLRVHLVFLLPLQVGFRTGTQQPACNQVHDLHGGSCSMSTSPSVSYISLVVLLRPDTRVVDPNAMLVKSQVQGGETYVTYVIHRIPIHSFALFTLLKKHNQSLHL